MDLMSILGIVCSVAILVFSEQQLDNYTFIEKVILFLVCQQLLVLLKFFVQYLIPSDPEWVEELSDRNVFVR